MNWITVFWLFLLIVSPFVYSHSSSQDIAMFGNIAKVFSLLIASFTLTFTQNAYAPGDTPQKAWSAIACGIWTWLFAQAMLAYYKIIIFKDIYPSLADLFFMIGYAPLLFGLVSLVKDFRSTGLPMGTRRSYLIQIVGLIAAYIIIYATLLHALLIKDDPLITKLVNVGYPTLDFLVIFLASILFRITIVLRGGSLGRSWIALVAGFVVLGVADISFAYNPAPWLDVMFFSSYFLIALSGLYQLQMLRQ